MDLNQISKLYNSPFITPESTLIHRVSIVIYSVPINSSHFYLNFLKSAYYFKVPSISATNFLKGLEKEEEQEIKLPSSTE